MTVATKPSYGKFIPAPLPRWESNFNRIFWIIHSFLAFVIAYYTTNGAVRQWIGHWLKPSGYLSGFDLDIADAEWFFYKQNISGMLLAYALHSIVFHVYYEYVPKNAASLVACIALQLGLNMLLTSWHCILACTILATFVIFLTNLFRNQFISWILCISFLLNAYRIAPFSTSSYTYYLEFNMYAYSCLRIINVCIFLSKNRETTIDKNLFLKICQYMVYLPYSITLIVLFDDFCNQLRNKEDSKSTYGLRSTIFFGVRLIFWAIFLDLILHFVYAHAVYNSPSTLLEHMNSYQLMSISYVVGQFFHVKYVVLFGVPAFFARLDGMVPPAPPICISRVSRYSRIWRHFDVGLHNFLKHQVYIPLMKGATGFTATFLRLLSLFCVFFIVLVWHGFESHYVLWVSLSAFELVVEWVGRTIWETEHFQDFRKTVGEQNTRRIISLGMLATVIPGIFGVFCFLGRSGIGSTVIRKVLLDGITEVATLRILANGLLSPGIIFLHMMTLGYFFSNYTLEFDITKNIKQE